MRNQDDELARFVASRLRDLRMKRGLSQEKVLFETGIYVEGIESTTRNVTISTLVALCALLGSTLAEFFSSREFRDSSDYVPTNTDQSSTSPAQNRKHIWNEVALRKIAVGARELRLATGKGQKEVIRETGINVGNIEAALFNSTIKTVARLCQYYGVTLEEFFLKVGL